MSGWARPARPVAPMAVAVTIVALWWLVAHNAGVGWVQLLGDLVFGVLLIGIVGPSLVATRARLEVVDAPADAVAGMAVDVFVKANTRLRIRPVVPSGPEVFVGPVGRRGTVGERVTVVPQRRGVYASVTLDTRLGGSVRPAMVEPTCARLRSRPSCTCRPVAGVRRDPVRARTRRPERWSTGPGPTRAFRGAHDPTRRVTTVASSIGGRRRTPAG